MLKAARKQFNALDKDGNGTLEGIELTSLVQWVCTKFNPGDDGPGSLDPEQVQAELDQLMATVDTDGDGTVTFGEFSEWFVKTARAIHRKRRRLQATEDSFAVLSAGDEPDEQMQVAAATESVDEDAPGLENQEQIVAQVAVQHETESAGTQPTQSKLALHSELELEPEP